MYSAIKGKSLETESPDVSEVIEAVLEWREGEKEYDEIFNGKVFEYIVYKEKRIIEHPKLWSL